MKIKSIVLFTLLISTFTIQLSAQSLRTFSGEYEDGEVEPGKATFTYYEDANTREFIKHGAFKYHLISKSDGGNYTLTVSGNYKNNKKEGIWNYAVNELDYHRTNGYFTETMKLTSNYKNGLPNGLWSYSRAAKVRNKRPTLQGFVWTAYQILPSESVTATFKNGVVIGDVKFINNPPYSEYTNISGQFNTKGYMNGQWTFTSRDKIKTVLLKNGIVSEFIVRSKSSGKILSKDIDDSEMSKLKDEFFVGKIDKVQLKGQRIKIDTLDAVKNNHYDFVMSFNRSEFKHRYIGGDDSYYYAKSEDEQNVNDNGFVDKRNYGSFVLFTKAKIYELSELAAYNELKNNLREGRNERSMVDDYNYFLKNYSDNLKLDDLEKVKVDYELAIYNNRRKSIADEIQNAQSWVKHNSYKNAIDDYNKILSKWKEILTEEETAFITLKIKEAQDKFDSVVKKANAEKENNDQLGKLNINRILIERQAKEISKAYGFVANVYNSGDAKIKKNIFWAYNNVYNDYAIKIQNTLNNDERLKLTEQVIRLQGRALELSKIDDTRKMEKAIKKAKTVEEQNTFFN